MKTGILCIACCMSFVCAIGCNRLPKPPEGMPELTDCTVVVTFGGEKMEGVSVLFQPKVKEENNWAAGGQTDSEGKAVMKTAAYYDGVAPGEYTISFQKVEPDGMGPGRSLIPLKYSNNNSKETIVVSKSQSEYVFALDALGADLK